MNTLRCLPFKRSKCWSTQCKQSFVGNLYEFCMNFKRNRSRWALWIMSCRLVRWTGILSQCLSEACSESGQNAIHWHTCRRLPFSPKIMTDRLGNAIQNRYYIKQTCDEEHHYDLFAKQLTWSVLIVFIRFDSGIISQRFRSMRTQWFAPVCFTCVWLFRTLRPCARRSLFLAPLAITAALMGW